ncbi:DNA polymerase III alpha subunit [Bacillus phage vB_BauM_KLEB27-3]|nr:DNA polymerase III alpha subunit [Bacillus phage vB_BauM_KLEB27-3]
MFKGMNEVDFEILNAGIALYRPGPMENIPEFQARANGMKEFEYLSPEVEEVTKSTFGILVYQEQIMQLAVKLAGYTAGESDILRKAVGKKKESVMRPALKELHERILGKGHSKELADKMIEMIEPFVGYGFNRSHSAAYAFVAYQTAYFKTYYPIEFMAALLTIFGDDEDKVTEYIAEAKRMGIGIKPPDINLSQKGFTINGSDLIYGLGSIKGLGEAAIHNIMEARPFESMSHLIETVPKKQLNKKAIEALIFSGALDTIDEQIKALPTRMHIFDTVLKMRGDNIDLTEQINNFTKVDQYNLEHKLIGIFVSGHPLEDIAQPIDWDGMDFDERFQTAGIVTHVVETKTKMTQQPMAIINVDTLEGNKKVIIFPEQYAALDARLQQGLILKMNLTIKFNSNPNYEQRTIIAQKVTIPKRINKHILNPS